MNTKKYLSILKSGLSFLCLIYPLNLYSQYSFDFENGNLDPWQQTANKHWEISNKTPIQGKFSLHHCFDNPSAGVDQISFRYKSILDKNENITWTFSIRHGYNPSSSNNWATFLIADKAGEYMHPDSSIRALVLGVNYSGSDDCLILWKQDHGTLTSILKSRIDWEEFIKDSTASIMISRDAFGLWQWKIFDHKGKQLEAAFSHKDTFFPTPVYSGLFYKYSSSQDQKLWFDNYIIMGNFYKDTLPPQIDSSFIVNRNAISVLFNEPIDFTKISKENFISSLQIRQVDFSETNICTIYFEKPIESDKDIEITLINIPDLYNNKMPQEKIALKYHTPEKFDVLITEIMFDPTPALQLPPDEFIELFNKSKNTINTKKWKIEIGNSIYELPEFKIEPNQYLILTQKDKELEFKNYGNTLGIFSSEYTISNEGFTIVLKDSSNRIISFVNFETTWFSGLKAEGGWTLEMIDYKDPCNFKSNWSFSNNKSGGTPGAANSVIALNPDNQTPKITDLRVVGDSAVLLSLNESILSDSLTESKNYYSDYLGTPSKVEYTDASMQSIKLIFRDSIALNKFYHLKINSKLCDCSGNTFDQKEYVFAKTEEAKSSEIIINEILFDAYPGGSKFIELFNRSKKIIDIGKIYLCTYDTMDHEILSHIQIAPSGFTLFPDSFLAICSNLEELQKDYPKINRNSIKELQAFPTLNDKQGIVSLVNSKFETLDSIFYSYHFQSSFLSSREGVSLERISSETKGLSNFNWQSAAQTVGFATPGYRNSINISNTFNDAEIIFPEVFTPNNDGIDDRLYIRLNSGDMPAKTSVTIYSSSGTLIKELLKQQYIQSNYKIFWDGSNNSGQRVNSGIYLVYIQSFFENGKTEIHKKTCVLSNK